MGLCPSTCGDTTLIGNPQGNCDTSFRQTTPSRLIFWECNVTLPDPITDENIAPLFANGTIVWSQPLADIVFADPTYETLTLDDCRPPLQYVATREMTFNDKTSVTTAASSPAEINIYADYDFWQDKLDNQARLNYGIVYCNGDVKLARASDGTLLTAAVTAVLNYQKPTNGGSSTEFKQISVTFQGDPLALTNKPEFNLVDAGINL